MSRTRGRSGARPLHVRPLNSSLQLREVTSVNPIFQGGKARPRKGYVTYSSHRESKRRSQGLSLGIGGVWGLALRSLPLGGPPFTTAGGTDEGEDWESNPTFPKLQRPPAWRPGPRARKLRPREAERLAVTHTATGQRAQLGSARGSG